MLIKKLTASLYHFIISLLVVGAFLALVKFYWYPDHLLSLSGVTSILFILIAIDIILGPLMTFVVYKPNKPKLKLDLSIIAVLQIAAFSYGMFTIYQGHPVYIVYAVNNFTIATANEIDPTQASNKHLIKSKLAGPQIAFAKIPENPKEAADILFGAFEGKPDIDKLPQYFEPYDQHLDDIFAQSIDLTKLLDKKETKQELEKFFSHNGDKGDFAYLPLVGKSKDVILAFNKKTGKPVGIIDIDPYRMAVNKQ
jgi:hypothetical protein